MDLCSGQTHALSRPLCFKTGILALKWIKLIQQLDGQLFENYMSGNLHGCLLLKNDVWMGTPCTSYVWIDTKMKTALRTPSLG